MSAVATVAVTMTAVNDAPVAGDDSFTTAEDTALTVGAPGVLGNDTDVDSATLTAVLVAGPSHGTLTLNANGSFTYTPAANFNGSDNFTYQASDGSLSSNVATVSLTITSVVDTGAIQGVKFEDLDGDGIQDTGEPGLAGWTIQLDLNNDGSVDATAVTNSSGAYAFLNVAPGTHAVREVVQAGWIQTAPLGGAYAVTVGEGQVVSGRDFGNFELGTISGVKFEDLDGDGIRDTGEPGLAGWTIQLDLNNDGSVDATAVTNSSGAYTFTNLTPGTHAVREVGQAGWVQTTPEFTVVLRGADEVGPKDTPAMGYAALSLNEATSTLVFDVTFDPLLGPTTGLHIHRGAPGVNGPIIYDLGALAGLTSPVRGTTAFNPTDLANLQTGNLYINAHSTVNPGGEIRGQILPGSGHLVPVTSGRVATERNFGNRNLAPVANDDGYAVAEDEVLTVPGAGRPGLFANDSDASGDAFTASVVSGPVNGTLLAFDGLTGAFTYRPNTNYFGPDSFVYRITDTHGGTDEATVALTITAVNDAPVAGNDSSTTAEDTALTVGAPGVLGNDTDVDSATLTAVLVAGPSHGTLALNTNGSFTYTPAANFNGRDSFTYTASDGALSSNVATVALTITAVNDAPVAANDSFTTAEDTALTVGAPGVLSNDTDVDSATLTAALVAGPRHGTLALNTNGSFTYTPAANFNGTDSFAYTASDGALGSNVATVALTITAVNDAPVAGNDSFTTAEDTALTVAAPGVLGNDTDVDSATLTAALVE